MNNECNADAGQACDANDGEPCESCQADRDYWFAYFSGFPKSCFVKQSKEELDAELRDAGRGHLVRS